MIKIKRMIRPKLKLASTVLQFYIIVNYTNLFDLMIIFNALVYVISKKKYM